MTATMPLPPRLIANVEGYRLADVVLGSGGPVVLLRAPVQRPPARRDAAAGVRRTLPCA